MSIKIYIFATEQNPLGKIFYDYTYYRVQNKRYSSMTGNNVTYTYGTSGTSRGRPIHISDGTGSHELTYDALGNVTAETRIIVLPNSHEEFSLGMNYEYDSWGRILSMTYPDGEVVSYTYRWGGDLYSMHGNKGDNHRVYVSKILYNTFGQRSQVEYGNQTKAFYTYDALHRLVNLKSRNGGGTLMQDINYTFDSASNVTGITNTAGVVNSLGGGYGNTYQYDALHRLVGSTGGGASTGTYDIDMGYTGSGRIKSKYRSIQSPTLSRTVNMYYGYCDEYQPHAVRRIYDEYNQKHYDFRWDASGNLGQVSYGDGDAQFESGRFMYWTEDSRMHVAVDDNHYSYYAYDYSGERRIKLTGDNSVLDVNADYMSTISTLEKVTLYPSAYMVLTDRGYTKHYYTGMERVAARIGDGGLDVGFYLSNTDSLHARANRLFGQSLAQVNGRVLEANDVDCIMDGEMPVEELGIPFEEIPEQMSATVGTEYGEFVGAMHLVSNAGESPEVYYYHGDHLGSASWITDASGTAVQHLQYLPFGERFVDQRTSGYSERFTFTGKERDSETGYGYFGARYMDHELMTMWLSVDPMADKYPSISPYAYCAGNPVKLVDPDGREMGDFYSKDGTYLNTDGKNDGKVYIVSDEAWGAKIKKDRLNGKTATLDLDKVERFQDENGNDLFLTEDIIRKISSAENLSRDGNEHGYFYRRDNETPERELESFPDHLTFNKYPDLWLSMHTHPQEQDATMSEQDHADMDQIPINIVIGNNKPYESGNVKTSNSPTYRVVKFHRHGKPAFSMNMSYVNKMVERINNKNK